MGEEWHRQTACELGDGIGHGDIDPRDLCEHFLARIAAQDPDHLIYLRTTVDRARDEAAAAAARAADGRRRSRLDGVPISWKDLYDTAGVATEGGTPLLAGRVPKHDARVLQRATRAGCVCLGKTNTVQFALGGIGSNPATGTPPSTAMTDVPRAPGGSSSGAATSVAHGLAPIGIGSDTGGSVRIPSAWNRLVGLKTSFGALPLDGVLPLSPSLDTVGPLTKSVADAAEIFIIMAARKPLDLSHASLDGARFLVAESVVWRDVAPEVDSAVKAAIAQLEAAGATVDWAPIPEFEDIDRILNTLGGVVTAEGYVTWKTLIDEHGDQIDPAVLARFHQGRDMSASDLLTVGAAAKTLSQSLGRRLAGYSALLAPTIPILPPPLADVTADLDAYSAANAKALRNTRLGNMLPMCALTLPCPATELPVGLMAMAPLGDDGRLLRLGAAMEAGLAS
jgi:aspartyl-tRNA(Asn)/glutamyl-tRNA(Gln) amidotransferase subunit A